MKPSFIDAIAALHPDINFSVRNDKIVAWDISEVKKNIPKPTQADIETKLTELLADYDAKKYQRDRIYPPIGDQLDQIYWDGIDEWKKVIKAVKDAHPKPK